MRSLVVLSGGLDSCVALALAQRESEYVETISFDYGQRHKKELESAQKISHHYDCVWRKEPVSLGHGGVLMDQGAQMPQMTYMELGQKVGPSPTYVPYRNGTFLSHATSIALERNIDTVYAGMHAEDAHNWAYPDCTPEFIGAMQNAIYIGTYFKVRLVCPFTYKSKTDIVKLGIELGAPLHLTWSCYEGGETACGKCPTCVGRLEAFSAAGYDDPAEYEFDKYRSRNQRSRMIADASSQLNAMMARSDADDES